VLASAALPLLFPARRIDGSFFCDGGLRFNTPIAPAIRTGARKLVIVALRAARTAADAKDTLEEYPNPLFLIGKVFDALLLDPVDYDLRVLARFNRLMEAMEVGVTPATLRRVRQILTADRGLPYRRVETLVFRPSEDIGVLALEHEKKTGCARSL